MHWHARIGTRARTSGVGIGMTGCTCGGFASSSYCPAKQTISILNQIDKRPDLRRRWAEAANICEDTNRGGKKMHSTPVMVQVNDLSSMYWQQKNCLEQLYSNSTLNLQCDSPIRILLELIDRFHKLICHSVNF